jgi:hypothetical protein
MNPIQTPTPLSDDAKDLLILKAAFSIICARGLQSFSAKQELHQAITELEARVDG